MLNTPASRRLPLAFARRLSAIVIPFALRNEGSAARDLQLRSPDQKSVYVSAVEKTGSIVVWKWSVDGLSPEKLVDNCGYFNDIDPTGQYLLGIANSGEKTGIYEIHISDKKCIPLLSSASTFTATFARDGKSSLYAVPSPGEVTIYRQPWKDGKLIGTPQLALKVPFAFPLSHAIGNAYDFSNDLSTLVYARPGGHQDLYLLSQK